MTDLRAGILLLFAEAARMGRRRDATGMRVFKLAKPTFDPFAAFGPETRYVVTVERPSSAFPRVRGFSWLVLAEGYAGRAQRVGRRPQIHVRGAA